MAILFMLSGKPAAADFRATSVFLCIFRTFCARPKTDPARHSVNP